MPLNEPGMKAAAEVFSVDRIWSNGMLLALARRQKYDASVSSSINGGKTGIICILLEYFILENFQSELMIVSLPFVSYWRNVT